MLHSGFILVKNFALNGVLLYAVTSPLSEVMMVFRVVALFRNPAFGVSFVIKLLGGVLLELLLQNALTYRNKTSFLTYYETCQYKDKTKPR